MKAIAYFLFWHKTFVEVLTCARITFEDYEYISPDFQETPWKQEAPILLNGAKTGIVQAFYTDKFPDSYEGPFLREERLLIDEIAVRLGNIIKQKKEAELLATERRRLADIIEGTNVGTWEWNVRTGEIIFNERWANIIGYTLEEISPVSIDTWLEYVHPDDQKKSGALLEKHFAGESDYYECEARMRHKNGSWVWVLDRGKVAAWTEDGKPLLMSGTHKDITEQKRSEEKIRHLVNHDALTGLPTLRLVNDRISMAIGLARRNKNMVGVMFIDLDGFKAVNDNCGHDAGDAVLREVAKRLLSSVRASDTAARIGGDEFLIILTELHTRYEAEQIAKKLVRIVSQPFTLKRKKVTVGASIGIALYPDNGEDIQRLIKLADRAMYKIKNSGKNGYAFASST